ncbi:MAG: hypothetical protein U1C96_04125 [Gallionella sp.]|nr:hypothetical protein [Gallionella sp.]
MMHYTNLIHRLLPVLLLLLSCFMAQNAAAQWWRFGTDANEPVFTDLLFNQVSALRVERTLHFTPDDMDGGKVIVRGRAEVGQGKIGRVEASLDGGVAWIEVPFNERGLFAFEFAPEPERAYRFRIRALSTTGQASNDVDHAFEFKVVRQDARALARAAFEQLQERYMARDHSGFMALVSRDFAGNESALDSALNNDFRFFDSIRISPTIQRMAAADDRWTIYFAFNRQVRSVRSGQLLQDQAYTSVTLIREGEGYKLHEMAAPLIFGVSDPGNVATFVTDESVGTEVLVVDQDGNISKRDQGQQVDNAGSIGNIPLSMGQLTVPGHPPAGFDFASGTQSVGFGTGDFTATGGDSGNGVWVGLESGVSFQDIGSVSIETLNVAPATGYTAPAMSFYLQPGRSYAFRLANGTYALLRIVSVIVPALAPPNYVIVNLEYRHQPDGSRNF